MTQSNSSVEAVARAIMRDLGIDPDVYIGMHGSLAPWDETARAALASIPLPDKEVERVCQICGATVATSDEAMACHCTERPWSLRTPTNGGDHA